MIGIAPFTDGRSMTDLNLGALTLVRDRVRKRAADPRLALVPGLADDLKLIGEAFGTLEHATRGIASIVLKKHHLSDAMLERDEWELLTRLAGEKVPWDRGHAHS